MNPKKHHPKKNVKKEWYEPKYEVGTMVKIIGDKKIFGRYVGRVGKLVNYTLQRCRETVYDIKLRDGTVVQCYGIDITKRKEGGK